MLLYDKVQVNTAHALNDFGVYRIDPSVTCEGYNIQERISVARIFANQGFIVGLSLDF